MDGGDGDGDGEDAKARIARLGAELDSLAQPDDLPGMILSGNAVRRSEYLEAANRKRSEIIAAYREHTAHLEGLVAAALEIQSELTELVRMQSEMAQDGPGKAAGRRGGGGGTARKAASAGKSAGRRGGGGGTARKAASAGKSAGRRGGGGGTARKAASAGKSAGRRGGGGTARKAASAGKSKPVRRRR